MCATEQNIVPSALYLKDSSSSGFGSIRESQTGDVDKKLSDEDAALLASLLSEHEAWMRDYKAVFVRRYGEVDAEFASTMTDPEIMALPDGRDVKIFDRTDEDIDTDSVRTYDVFFDRGGFRIKHVPLADCIEVCAEVNDDQANTQDDGFNGDHLMFFPPNTPENERQRMLYEQMFLSNNLSRPERFRLALSQYLSAERNLRFLAEVDPQKVFDECGTSIDEQYLDWVGSTFLLDPLDSSLADILKEELADQLAGRSRMVA